MKGYKFNIFYPNLKEGVTPRFELENIENKSNLCKIKFTVDGQGYDDLVFII